MAILARIANDVQLMFRRPPRQQYAALCYRVKKKTGELEVLLLTSRDTGRWVIPKGWPMPGKLSHEVAAREAFEEAGVTGTISDTPVGNFPYLKDRKDGSVIACSVDVFTLEVTGQKDNWMEKSEREQMWLPLDEAIAKLSEPGLRIILRDFAARRSAQRRHAS